MALYSGKKALDVGAKKQEGKDALDTNGVTLTPDGKLAPGTKLMQGPNFGNGLSQAMKALGPKEDPVQSTHISYDDKGAGTATSITKSGKVLDPVPLGAIGKSAKPAKDPNSITAFQQAQLDRQAKAADDKKMAYHVMGQMAAHEQITDLEKEKLPFLKENQQLAARSIALGNGSNTQEPVYGPDEAAARDAEIAQIKARYASNATEIKKKIDRQHEIAQQWGGAAPTTPPVSQTTPATTPAPQNGAAAAQPKQATSAQVQAYAAKKGIAPAAALQEFQQFGYKVQ